MKNDLPLRNALANNSHFKGDLIFQGIRLRSSSSSVSISFARDLAFSSPSWALNLSLSALTLSVAACMSLSASSQPSTSGLIIISETTSCGESTVHCLEVVRVELFIFNKAFTPAIHAVARGIDLARPC